MTKIEKENRICPKCGSEKSQHVHAKTQKGKIRYLCKNCKKTYILEEPQYNDEFKRQAVEMYLSGHSALSVSRFFQIGKNTIWNWLRKYKEAHKNDFV